MVDASILMTVFNGESYIEAAVRSACSQRMCDFEIVVVDDGSTDRSLQKIEALQDSRVRIFHCQRHGRAKALNFGLKQCAGAYVAVLDADDIALPGRLFRQVSFLASNRDIAVVGSCRRPFIDTDGRLTGREDMLPDSFDAILGWMEAMKCPMFHSAVMFRKELVLGIGGYDESLECYLDFDLYVRTAKRSKLANLPHRLSLKRRHADQYFGGQRGLHLGEGGKAAKTIIERRVMETLARSPVTHPPEHVQ